PRPPPGRAPTAVARGRCPDAAGRGRIRVHRADLRRSRRLVADKGRAEALSTGDRRTVDGRLAPRARTHLLRPLYARHPDFRGPARTRGGKMAGCGDLRG